MIKYVSFLASFHGNSGEVVFQHSIWQQKCCTKQKPLLVEIDTTYHNLDVHEQNDTRFSECHKN